MTMEERLCKQIQKNKDIVENYIAHGALNRNTGIAHIQRLLEEIKRDRRMLRELNEKKDVLQRYEEFTHWGHGSEDGDWVFMEMRETEFQNANDKWKRIQRRERKLKK